MPISFSGGKSFKLHNGFSEQSEIKPAIASPIHVYKLRQGKNLLLNPLVRAGDRI